MDFLRSRIVLGYMLLTMGFVVGVWGITRWTDERLRRDLNTIIVNNCIQSINTLKAYNESLEADIEVQKDARVINLSRNDIVRARLNNKIIQYKKQAKIQVPTVEECKQRKEF